MEDESFMDILEEKAKGIISSNMQHIPIAFVIKEDEGLEIVALMFKTPEEKITMLDKLKTIISNANSTKYFFICEGWQSTAENVIKTGKLPSQQEDKSEVLIISKFDKKEGTFERIIPIIRKGQTITFGDYILNEYKTGFSIFNIWHPNQVVLDK